jgi:hypothetical protein
MLTSKTIRRASTLMAKARGIQRKQVCFGDRQPTRWMPMPPAPEEADPAQPDADEFEFGCDYCRNDGKLDESGVCPKCDAQWLEEDQ